MAFFPQVTAVRFDPYFESAEPTGPVSPAAPRTYRLASVGWDAKLCLWDFWSGGLRGGEEEGGRGRGEM